MVFLSPSRQIKVYYFHQAKTASYQILPNSSFIYRPTSGRCTTARKNDVERSVGKDSEGGDVAYT